MPSESFLRRNPRYREAEWKSRGPREKRPEPGSNLDTFHFQNQGYSRDEAQQMSTEAKASGMRTGFGGKGIEPDRNLTPRDRVRMGFDRGRGRSPTGPTDDQRKWAQKFRESSTPQKPASSSTPSANDTPGAASASARQSFLQRNGMKPQATDTRPPLRSAAAPNPAPEKPLNFSRSALVEGAKSSGDFANIRKGFNTQSAAAQTGMRMNARGVAEPLSKAPSGPDGTSKFAREKFGPAVEDIRARRDFARGEAPVQFNRAPEGAFAGQESLRSQTSRPIVSAEKVNPYGTATATFGPRAPGAGGTMTDPLTGKTVPMKSYLAQQSAVQDTRAGTSGVGENRTSNDAGDDYFDPKKVRQSFQQRRARV